MSLWGSSNYRPSAPFLYEVASHVKKTAIPAIIIIIIMFERSYHARGYHYIV